MPYKPKHPCAHGMCPKLAEYGHAYCEEHEREHKRERGRKHDANRASASRRGYNARWRRARLLWLHSHPLCEECKRKGLYVSADVVDHIIPHKGNQKLFWDEDNWQSLCKKCHDTKTATEDRKKEKRVYEYDFKK